MAVDNRTMLNDCTTSTGWTGDDNANPINLTGLFYEGTTALSTQLSNADEYMATTQNSTGGTDNGTFSLDFSDTTCYMIIKDNLVEDQTNGGVKFVLGDGTRTQGFEIGGFDNTGVPLPKFFNAYRLDVSNRATFTIFNFVSSGTLTATAITEIGYGSLHLSKAQGAIDNVFMDAFRYLANTSYALTVDGGTSTVPITLDTLATDDETNGWGLIANPIGSQYIIGGTFEFGTTAANTDAYFSQSDSQIYLNGTGIGAGNFFFRTIGEAGTGTQSFSLTNCTVVGTGEPGSWDFSDTNHDILTLIDTQFVNNGTFVFPSNTGNRSMTGGGFTDCDQINFDTMSVSNISINGSISSATGAIILDASGNSTNQTNISFSSGGSGHGVYITAAGTYDFTSWTFSGFSTASPGTNNTPASGSTDAMVYNDSGGAVTINVSGGTNVTVRNGTGATTTVVATVNFTVTVLDADTNNINGAVVAVYDVATDTELINDETVNGQVSGSASPTTDYYIRVRYSTSGNTRYIPVETVASTGSGDFSTTITLIEDLIVSA